MLWLYQRTMFGTPDTPENQNMSDMNYREIGYMLPLVILMFWIGLYPRPYLNLMQPTVNHYVAQMQARQKAAQAERDSVQAPRQASTATSDTLAAQTEGR
jgi:NADH-quinone oxidoreductase subunit M